MFHAGKFLKDKYVYSLSCLIFPASLFSQVVLLPCPTDPNQTWSQCTGVIEKEGNKYSGEFQNNLFHGKGMYVFVGGDYYNGQFHEGVPHGWGMYVFLADNPLKGDRYVGEFKDGQAHGRGTTFFKVGAVYTGQYAFGLPDGLGMYIDPKGTVLHEGQWQQGKFLKPAFVVSDSVSQLQNETDSTGLSEELNQLKEKFNDLENAFMQQKIVESQLRQSIESMRQALWIQTNPTVSQSELQPKQLPVHPIVELKSQDLNVKNDGVVIRQRIKVQQRSNKKESKSKSGSGQAVPDPMKDAFLYLQ